MPAILQNHARQGQGIFAEDGVFQQAVNLKMLDQLKSATTIQAAGFFLAVNFVIFCGSILLCRFLGAAFRGRRLFHRWEPLRRLDLAAASASVILNSGISVFGWWLWTQNVIVLRPAGFLGSTMDCLVMVLAMDLGMYVFHRMAHWPPFYKAIHGFHHRHESTNPLSLFVLHPLEVVGFGGLMILFLAVYPVSPDGLTGYLALNVLFGTLGHSGVEPFPARLRSVPLLNLVGSSTFHAEHHEHPAYNFGFYTLIWDRLFGTLDPEYEVRFADATRGSRN